MTNSKPIEASLAANPVAIIEALARSMLEKKV
jgi:hypothetical protein